MQPGTRMPTIFPDGRSTLDDVLGGQADTQAAAMWTYLSLGMNLSLPEGLEPPKGLILTVKDQPVLLRTFMPDAGAKAIAVGYPQDISVAFDAATCRLAYAWSGNFLDAAPVWNDRGGNPAKPLGPRFWTAPQGFSWTLTTGNDLPDFAAQARDPAFGAPQPEGTVYHGPVRLHFEGYAKDPQGFPVFKYHLDGSAAQVMEVRERIRPQRTPSAVGLARQFELTQPADFTAWLLAGETMGRPRVLDAQGNEVALGREETGMEAASRMLVLPSDGQRFTVLKVAEVPAGAQWILRHQGDGWRALLRLPAAQQKQATRLTLLIWRPHRSDTGAIQDLLTAAPPK
jgi:hypothetical protein